MLTAGQSGTSAAALQICSICDGLDAVLLLAAYVAQHPAGMQRHDLPIGAALDHLKGHSDLRFDQIIIAPDDQRQGTPHLLEALIAQARLHSNQVVILLPRKARTKISPALGVSVLHGPPFEAYDAVSGQSMPGAEPPPPDTLPKAFWQKWLKKPARDTSLQAVEGFVSQQPVLAQLPDQLRALAVQPLAGGVGGTIVAVNLAVELATLNPKARVLLLDLNLQFGNVSTYLNLGGNTRILDAYRGLAKLDAEAMELCLKRPLPNLAVFAAPDEILPVDAITPAELRRILTIAREKSDILIIDLPHMISDWSESTYLGVDCVLAVSSLDVRAAQNAAKLRALLSQDTVSPDRLFPVLNFVPKKTNAVWTAQAEAFERGSGTKILKKLPLAGEEVLAACNAGKPLAEAAPQSPLRNAIRDLAQSISDAMAPLAAKKKDAA